MCWVISDYPTCWVDARACATNSYPQVTPTHSTPPQLLAVRTLDGQVSLWPDQIPREVLGKEKKKPAILFGLLRAVPPSSSVAYWETPWETQLYTSKVCYVCTILSPQCSIYINKMYIKLTVVTVYVGYRNSMWHGRRWRSWIVRLVSDREVAGSSPALGDTWRWVLRQDT